MKITIINGPNLNLLGSREPGLYGDSAFGEVLSALQSRFAEAEITYQQFNTEHEIVEAIHRCAADGCNGIVLNPAAFTHTSLAVADAVAAVAVPVVEVHISNIWSREPYRTRSYVSPYAAGVISGFGTEGYALALHYLTRS